MAFFETPRFPEGVSAGAVFGPAWSTQVGQALGGAEQRNQRWSSMLRKGTVGHDIQDQTDYNALLDFFNVAQGKTHGWRFKDWSDFNVDSISGRLGNLGVNSACGTSTGSLSYQLFKRYTNSSGLYRDRVIAKPVSGQISVYRAGSLVAWGASSGQASVDTTSGVVTFVAAPASGVALTWVGQFDTPCRFDTDHMAGVTHLINNESWPSIPIVEIRV
jgi:uncharacterized protein (TIGR02217 family)